MEQNPNRIIYREGQMWVNYRLDGYGPDTNHRKLNLAIQRAAHCIRKIGEGQLIIKDRNCNTTVNDTIVCDVVIK